MYEKKHLHDWDDLGYFRSAQVLSGRGYLLR